MPELKIGDRVPSFQLPDQQGQPFSMDDNLGKGPLVLFFYPKDGTPGCTVEACEFRDTHEDFVAAGATVIGISSDSPESHAQFARRNALGYRLLADVEGTVRAQFGVPRSMFGLVDGRTTYVIDEAGIVRHRFDSMLRVKRHAEEALQVVRQLQRA